MKQFLRDALSDFTYQTLRFRHSTQPRLRILMYHRVTDAHPDDRLCVPVARFDAQMRFLHGAGYRTITFAEAVRWVQQGGALPDRAIVLTFDDGFEDNFLNAYPAMTRQGFTGIFFIPS